MENQISNSSFTVQDKPETYLVTGATGAVGKLLVHELLQKGKQVRALTRNSGKTGFPDEVEIVHGDLTRPESLTGVFEGVAHMHLITFNGANSEPLQTGPELVRLAEKAGVKRCTVLWSGFMGSVEEAVKKSSLEWTILCPQEFMKNTLEWAETIRKEGVVREAFGSRLTAMIHEGDIARVAATVLTEGGHDGKEYTMTGPEVLKLSDTVKAISRSTGHSIGWIELTEEQLRDRMKTRGVEEGIIEFVVSWHRDTPVEGYTVVPTVEQITGQPARTFDQWVEDNQQAFL